METRELRPGYRISRIIRGGWQLAGGHGEVERDAAIADLVASAEAGILTFDCADIYTGVEELIGAAGHRGIVERGVQPELAEQGLLRRWHRWPMTRSQFGNAYLKAIGRGAGNARLPSASIIRSRNVPRLTAVRGGDASPLRQQRARA